MRNKKHPSNLFLAVGLLLNILVLITAGRKSRMVTVRLASKSHQNDPQFEITNLIKLLVAVKPRTIHFLLNLICASQLGSVQVLYKQVFPNSGPP